MVTRQGVPSSRQPTSPAWSALVSLWFGTPRLLLSPGPSGSLLSPHGVANPSDCLFLNADFSCPHFSVAFTIVLTCPAFLLPPHTPVGSSPFPSPWRPSVSFRASQHTLASALCASRFLSRPSTPKPGPWGATFRRGCGRQKAKHRSRHEGRAGGLGCVPGREAHGSPVAFPPAAGPSRVPLHPPGSVLEDPQAPRPCPWTPHLSLPLGCPATHLDQFLAQGRPSRNICCLTDSSSCQDC